MSFFTAEQTIFFVDDDAALREANVQTLDLAGLTAAAFPDAHSVLPRIAADFPGVVVTDIRMPGMDGYQLVRNLRSAPHTRLIPIVFLTAKDETADRIAGFRSGVDAYITKPFEAEELIAIVASILERVQRTHTGLAQLFGEPDDEDENKFQRDEELTDAEWRVAETVARGLSNKEIAAELNLSLRTVEGHISHILDKKNLGNRVELALQMIGRKHSH